MHRGDFILTPTWRYHVRHSCGVIQDSPGARYLTSHPTLRHQDHGNDSSAKPMIWLDGLDLPQFQHFPVHFVQHYSESRYPAKDAPSSTVVYPWVEMEKKLEATAGESDHSIVRYTSQEPGKEGQEVSKIIGAQCERIEAGTQSKPVRETTSAVYHVVEGKGSSVIGDKVIEWVKGDTFTVPSWEEYSHKVRPGDEKYFFSSYHCRY
jgi:gentisate 1,2-dioxygenase